MENKKDIKHQGKAKTSGNAKEKASFEQNGSGASDKYGKAGSTPNESGDNNRPATINKKNNNQFMKDKE